MSDTPGQEKRGVFTGTVVPHSDNTQVKREPPYPKGGDFHKRRGNKSRARKNQEAQIEDKKIKEASHFQGRSPN